MSYNLTSDLTQFGIFAVGSRARGVGIGDGGVGDGPNSYANTSGVLCTVGEEVRMRSPMDWMLFQL